MKDHEKEISFYFKKAVEAITIADEVINQLLNIKERSVKSKLVANDLVTDIDFAVEEAIITHLAKNFPDHRFLTEERYSRLELDHKDHYRWIIDPIDGTLNLTHGIEHYAISVALSYEDQVLMGMIYDVFKKRLYHAIRGKGAFCDSTPLRVSQTDHLQAALISTGFTAHDWYDRKMSIDPLAIFSGKTQAIRITGSTCIDLINLAEGKIDLFFHQHLAPWDYAAGALIVEEAGGICSDLDGKFNLYHNNFLLCGNPFLHRATLYLLLQNLTQTC